MVMSLWPRFFGHPVYQWFPSISDNGPKAISREVCGATSESKAKLSYTSTMGCCTKH